MAQAQQLMESERKLLADLNDFNTKYNRYTLCNNAYINPSTNPQNCSAADMKKDTVVDAYNKLKYPENPFGYFPFRKFSLPNFNSKAWIKSFSK